MFQGLLLIAICLSRASAQVIDLGTEAEVTNTYLESGFITLSASDKITITTSSTFSFPIVFLSTVFSSSEYSDAIPLEARVEQLADNGGAAVFTVQLVWPSNKTCVSEWSDGSSPQGSYTVGWYVGETGGYSVSGVQMEFVTAPVNAQSWTKTTWPYTFGSACHYPAQSGDDSYSPGAIFSLQSNNNDLQYLTVRSSSWFQTDRTQCNYAWKAGDLRMYPHDSNTVDTSAIQEETVGVLLFDTRFPQTLDCLAGSYLEIGQVTTLTDQPFQFIMYQPVDTSSVSLGVFGAVLTLEGGDAMMIKSFSPTSSPTDAYAFIQEDQCNDEETTHYPETFSYFLSTPTTTANCVDPVRGDHTYAPSHLPTPSPTALSRSSSTSSSSDDILLAVFLPICIVIVVVIVGFVTKKVFLTPPAKDDSEHSGVNLVP